jgi:hypothetical protein
VLNKQGFRCDNIGMQGKDCIAVNRWKLPRRPRSNRARISRAALFIFIFNAIVCFGAFALVARADDAANEAARELARKIAVILDAKLNFEIETIDISQLYSPTKVRTLEQAFEKELRDRGIHVVRKSSTGALIRLYFSENPRQKMLVAEWDKDEKMEVAVVEYSEFGSATDLPAPNIVRIVAKVLFDRDSQILDFDVITRDDSEAKNDIVILGLDTLSHFVWSSGQWRLDKTVPLPPQSKPSRDPQGHVAILQNKIFFGTTGIFCTGNLRDLSLDCDLNAKEWVFPMPPWEFHEEVIPGRNFFRNNDLPHTDPEFYFTRDKTVGAVADKNGGAWLSRIGKQPLILSETWGSNLASVTGVCGIDGILLVTGMRDYKSPDFLQAFQILEGSPVSVSLPVTLPGPVLQLRQSDSNPRSARAIVRNLLTGHYEAYEITLTCDH